mmetsp:Transcript_24413/g.84299  ORF Transcript_24413/g.84299 Transcript_24413/m.84299 type:complete len:324 (-) Transcript_24413:20-991(-)
MCGAKSALDPSTATRTRASATTATTTRTARCTARPRSSPRRRSGRFCSSASCTPRATQRRRRASTRRRKRAPRRRRLPTAVSVFRLCPFVVKSQQSRRPAGAAPQSRPADLRRVNGSGGGGGVSTRRRFAARAATRGEQRGEVRALRGTFRGAVASSPCFRPSRTGTKGSMQWYISSDLITVGSEIGRGSFGVVRRAKWRHTEVAIKVLYKDAQAEDRDLFEREVAIMATLHHPNIVQFLGFIRAPELALVLELFPDGSIENFVLKEKPSKEMSLSLCWDMALAIECALFSSVCISESSERCISAFLVTASALGTCTLARLPS